MFLFWGEQKLATGAQEGRDAFDVWKAPLVGGNPRENTIELC